MFNLIRLDLQCIELPFMAIRVGREESMPRVQSDLVLVNAPARLDAYLSNTNTHMRHFPIHWCIVIILDQGGFNMGFAQVYSVWASLLRSHESFHVDSFVDPVWSLRYWIHDS